MSFYFTKQQTKRFADINLLHKLECKLCPLYNLTSNKHKDISPHGSIKPGGIYILGQGPGADEDALGKFFVGKSGMFLKENFSEVQWSKLRVNNVTRTRTPNDDEPSYESIECCRPSIEKDIRLVKPKAIFGLGGIPLKWALPVDSDVTINAWRGHRFPVKIAGHVCWYFPLNHPAYVLRNMFLAHVFKLDVQNAYKFLERNIDPVLEDVSKAHENTEVLTSLSEIKTALAKIQLASFSVVDLETTKLRPYYLDSKILTVSVGTPEYSIAFPWQHPQAKWTLAEFTELKQLFYKFLCTDQTKVAHNTAFELEWLVTEYDDPSLTKWPWGDTQAAAYVLGYGGSEKKSSNQQGEFSGIARTQRGLLALDNLCMAYFGFFLKSISKIRRDNLVNESLTKVLKYNVLDTKYTAKLYVLMMADIAAEHLESVYIEQARRVPTVVLTQRKGLVYSPETAQTFSEEFTGKIKAIAKETIQHPSVVEYRTKFGDFNITTPKDVVGLFKYLGFNTKNSENKDSSDEEILRAIDHPVARNILAIRELSKVLGTYVEPFTSKSIIYPDGKLHTQFTTMFTTTSRLSSLDPNVQNFPKRKNKQIRKIIVAPEGYIFCSNDYGQIEARVLAMASKDPKFCEALWTGFDIHSYWALVIAKAYPARVGGIEVVARWKAAKIETLKDTDKLFKAFRDIVKNKWVFPAFFGASIKSLAGYMGIPYEVAEAVQKLFWKDYAVIKVWQETLYNFYKEHGYVETLTGHRRYMYMQGGEIINHPIQGTAAAIVLDGMNRLSEYARKTGKEQFQPIIQIHDDLGFYLPKETWEEDHKFIVREMLSCKFDFINVPLTVESAIGPDWYNLKEIGTFSSDKMEVL
jgi:uracil-DNA glycosylase family 4